MNIIAKLNKPYTEEEKLNFIVKYNHNQGFMINETEDGIEALGYSEEEKKALEQEELNMLSLTKREVFLALYEDKGITPEQLRAQITDVKALIEFDYANEYFRANPLINQIGISLGYTSEQIDYLFRNKEFKKDGADSLLQG